MDEDQNYKLIGGDNNKNIDEPTDKETAFLLNETSTPNIYSESRPSSQMNLSHSSSDIINNIINTFDMNNPLCKFIIGALLLHPIINLIIQDHPSVKKAFTKSQRKLIKRILIVIMLFCLIGFCMSTAPSDSGLLSFLLKTLLITFLLIHSNIFNIVNFDETIKFWKKILNKKD